MTSPAQKTFDFDMATLNRCISQITPKRKKTVFRGLLFAAANEPRLVDAIDAQGFVLMTAAIDKVAAWANVSARAIQINVDRVRAEEPGILEQSATINTAAEWMFNLHSVLPGSAVDWYVDLVEKVKSSPRTFEKFTPNFFSARGELFDLSSNSMKHAEHAHKTHAACQHESFGNSRSKSQSGKPKPGAVKFRDITPDHVQRIVKHRDAELFASYFRDVVKSGWARTDDSGRDRHRLAALFHQVVRVGKADSPGSVIYAGWKSRDEIGEDACGKPRGLTLSDEDEDFATELLRVRSDPATSAAAKVLLRGASDELTPEQIEEQRQRAESNLRALAAMQRAVPS